jgi:SIT4-associating protein SAP185/190
MVFTPTASEPEAEKPSDVSTEAEAGSADSSREDLSPHPEDRPAPLFSGKQVPADPISSPENMDTKEDKPPPAAPSPEQSPTTGMNETEPGEASVVIGQAGDAATEDCTSIEDSEITPVVGDYLKMQFVEYRVVPTILVRRPVPCLVSYN